MHLNERNQTTYNNSVCRKQKEKLGKEISKKKTKQKNTPLNHAFLSFAFLALGVGSGVKKGGNSKGMTLLSVALFN